MSSDIPPEDKGSLLQFIASTLELTSIKNGPMFSEFSASGLKVNPPYLISQLRAQLLQGEVPEAIGATPPIDPDGPSD